MSPNPCRSPSTCSEMFTKKTPLGHLLHNGLDSVHVGLIENARRGVDAGPHVAEADHVEPQLLHQLELAVTRQHLGKVPAPALLHSVAAMEDADPPELVVEVGVTRNVRGPDERRD